MRQALTILEETAGRVPVKPLTIEQYEAMVAGGILEENPRVEILNGVLVLKDRAAAGEDPLTIGPEHQLVINKLARLCSAIARRGCFLSIQGPVRIPPLQEPEPDAAIVAGEPEDYRRRHPGPDDIHCVLEVADSSLMRDRTTKQRIYAAAGIRQYVILNLVERRVEVYSAPSMKDGVYQSCAIRTGTETVGLAVGKSKSYLVKKAKDLLP